MRNQSYFAIMLLGLIITASIATAITATLGNSRMILRAEKGDTVENFLRVINTNDVPVTIELTASGDSEKDFKLKDEGFSLAPGEEKKAYFTIRAREEGTFTTKINVLFKPEEGNGVGLLANVILIVGNSDSDTDLDEEDSDTTLTGDVVQDEENLNSSGFSFGQKNTNNSKTSFSLSPSTILIGSTTLLIIILIILFIFLLKKPKKEARRPRE